MHVSLNKIEQINSMNNLKCTVCVCGGITDLLTPPSFCDRRQYILLLVEYNLVFHLINIISCFFLFNFLKSGQSVSNLG